MLEELVAETYEGLFFIEFVLWLCLFSSEYIYSFKHLAA